MNATAERDSRPYEHRFHAGNVGDVLKHVALLAWLARASAEGSGPRCYLETHAGAGRYRLGPTGEWREGVGRLLSRQEGAPPSVAAYLAALPERAPGPRGMRYLGSPLLAAGALLPGDALVLVERAPETADVLREALAGDARAQVVVGDGLAALAEAVAAPRDAELLVHVDPPWVEKSEWHAVPDALIALSRGAPQARAMLWYPVKSHTRPNAMMKRLQDARVPATLVELVTSPLTVQKNRLNGSGLIFVRPPAGLVEALSGALAFLGAALATHDGYWSQRVIAWGDRAPPRPAPEG